MSLGQLAIDLLFIQNPGRGAVYGQTKLSAFLAFNGRVSARALVLPWAMPGGRDLTDAPLNQHLHYDRRYGMLYAPEDVHERVHIDSKKFRAAARHSRHVRLLRKALPVGVALVLGWLALKSFRITDSLHVIPGSVAISGTRITMGSPRFSGMTQNARRVKRTAKPHVELGNCKRKP